MNVPLQFFSGAKAVVLDPLPEGGRIESWWLAAGGSPAGRAANDTAPERRAAAVAEPAAFPSRRFDLRDGIVIAIATAVAAAMLMTAASGAYSITAPEQARVHTPTSMSSDPTIGGRLLAARDLVADRQTDGLERAIGLLEGVTTQAPGFAPGHAGLAEALVLSREFGRRDDAAAFGQARQAALTAVRLDPRLASGHRLLAFIDYWHDRDFERSRVRFERALALAPDDFLTHFWYGNVLSDHGDHDAALVQLEKALALQPGSDAIRTDLAWARWAVGEDVAARAALNDVVRRQPGFAVAHDCLAVIAFVDGDARGYVRHFAKFAQARRDAGLIRRADELGRALKGGTEAVRRTVMGQALAEIADGSQNHAWAVLVASLRGEREMVVGLLRAADKAGEVWGDAALVPRIRAVWKADAEITGLIDKRLAGLDERQVSFLV